MKHQRFVAPAVAALAAWLVVAAPSVLANPAHGGHAGHAGSPTPSNVAPADTNSAGAADTLTRAEVRRIDRGTGRLTLRHEHIASLDMPPMTMVFGVREPAWLEGLQVGDQVLFAVVQESGRMIVTELKPVR